jgi:hypothetical protein
MEIEPLLDTGFMITVVLTGTTDDVRGGRERKGFETDDTFVG